MDDNAVITTVHVPTQAQEDKKRIAAEKAAERQRVHDMVVKHLNWSSSNPDAVERMKGNPITEEEWNVYQEHLLAISATNGVEKTQEKINDIELKIRSNGGFDF